MDRVYPRYASLLWMTFDFCMLVPYLLLEIASRLMKIPGRYLLRRKIKFYRSARLLMEIKDEFWGYLSRAMPSGSDYHPDEALKRTCNEMFRKDIRFQLRKWRFDRIVKNLSALLFAFVCYEVVYYQNDSFLARYFAVASSFLLTWLTILLLKRSRSTKISIGFAISLCVATYFLTVVSYGRRGLPSLALKSSPLPSMISGILFRASVVNLVLLSSIILISTVLGVVESINLSRSNATPRILTLLCEFLGMFDDSEENVKHLEAVDHARSTLLKVGGLMRNGLPRIASSSPIAQRQEFQDRCHHAAYYIDGLYLDILLPNPATYVEIRRKVAEIAAIIAMGHLGNLPSREKPRFGARGKAKYFLDLVQGLVLAFLPIAALYGAPLVGVRIAGSLNNWLTTGSIVWAVLSVLLMVDPGARDKIDLGQKVFSLLQGKGPASK